MTEAFIVGGLRSPIGRFGGALAGVRPDDLAAQAIKALIKKFPAVDFSKTDEVILGCTNQAAEDSRNVARMSLLLSGLPAQVPGVTVNRLCASGLEAAVQAARQIRLGEADLVIAGGVESMSRAPIVIPKGADPADKSNLYDSTIGWRFINEEMHRLYGTDSMPETAENLAEEFNISREDQDAYAFRSQMRTKAAKERGFFENEVCSIQTEEGMVSEDEHPRPTTTIEKLAGLDAPFRKNGTVTAGNASGINDGAAALLIASEKAIEEYGLQPLARIRGSYAVGVEPRIMGIGPVPAIKGLLKRHKTALNQIDHIEINEAFAVQVLACLRELELANDEERVNPNGGAIALGHPLGMSGARLALTTARALRPGGKGIASMCVGVGQGQAMLLEKV